MEFSFQEHYGIDDMLKIMELLRAPGGCPWDREQDHRTIRNNLIEETYEAVEAIDTEDTPLLREELGDVLLQVLFHCQIEREAGGFSFEDIVDELAKKMIVRHPHVFGEAEANTSGEVLKNWEEIKNRTKHRDTGTAVLKAVSPALPALMRAGKVQKKAKKLSFPEELKAAPQAEGITEENAGKLLFEAVRAVRAAGLEPEEALTRETAAYIARFEAWENTQA